MAQGRCSYGCGFELLFEVGAFVRVRLEFVFNLIPHVDKLLIVVALLSHEFWECNFNVSHFLMTSDLR